MSTKKIEPEEIIKYIESIFNLSKKSRITLHKYYNMNFRFDKDKKIVDFIISMIELIKKLNIIKNDYNKKIKSLFLNNRKNCDKLFLMAKNIGYKNKENCSVRITNLKTGQVTYFCNDKKSKIIFSKIDKEIKEHSFALKNIRESHKNKCIKLFNYYIKNRKFGNVKQIAKLFIINKGKNKEKFNLNKRMESFLKLNTQLNESMARISELIKLKDKNIDESKNVLQELDRRKETFIAYKKKAETILENLLTTHEVVKENEQPENNRKKLDLLDQLEDALLSGDVSNKLNIIAQLKKSVIDNKDLEDINDYPNKLHPKRKNKNLKNLLH